MRNKPWRCIFCGAVGRSKEHIWPAWLKPHISRPLTEHYHHSAELHDNRSDFVRKKYSGDPHSRGPKVVCAKCNSGWMSRLQTLANPCLISPVTGQPIILDPPAQKILAAWAAMEMMTAEFFDKYKVANSYEEREHVRLALSAPDSWKIWIGFFERRNWKGLWAHNVFPVAAEGDVPEIMDNGLPRPNTQSATLVVGKLYIHAFSSPFKEIRDMVDVAQDRIFLSQIWPLGERAIVWPTSPMSDREADKVASAFLSFVQKMDAFKPG